MVFGRRWCTEGGRAVTRALLLRARKLYLASLAVIALVGVLRLVPGLGTEVVTVSPRRPLVDLYDFDGPLQTVVAIATLEAGPWQFNILGFFVVALALAPLVLWALSRGWWAYVLVASAALFALGRTAEVEILPSQSEGPFPLLVWQALFVGGAVIGWHRQWVERAARASRGWLATTVLIAAAVAAYLRLNLLGHDPLGFQSLLGYAPADWVAWADAHFSKTWLDPARLAVIVSLAAGTYLMLRRFEPLAQRLVGWLLLPLGRNSFYVFIMHVFLCVAVASVPVLADGGLGPVGNAAIQLGCLGLLCAMVRRRFLFRWVPR
jgi:hypothetical protein